MSLYSFGIRITLISNNELGTFFSFMFFSQDHHYKVSLTLGPLPKIFNYSAHMDYGLCKEGGRQSGESSYLNSHTSFSDVSAATNT